MDVALDRGASTATQPDADSQRILNRDARVAGLLYCVAIALAIFALVSLPSRLGILYTLGRVVKLNDALLAAHAIATNEVAMRMMMAGEMLGAAFTLVVVLRLYRLLKGVDRPLASLMVILGAYMQLPLYFANVVNHGAAWLLVQPTDLFSVFSNVQRASMAMLFLRLHDYGLYASMLFGSLEACG